MITKLTTKCKSFSEILLENFCFRSDFGPFSAPPLKRNPWGISLISRQSDWSRAKDFSSLSLEIRKHLVFWSGSPPSRGTLIGSGNHTCFVWIWHTAEASQSLVHRSSQFSLCRLFTQWLTPKLCVIDDLYRFYHPCLLD